MNGFSTLVSAGCLVLFVALVGILVSSAQETQLRLQKIPGGLSQAQALRGHLKGLLDQSPWIDHPARGLPQGTEVSVEDWSGRLDWNTVPAEVLGTTALAPTLLQPIEAFQAHRTQVGLIRTRSDLRPWLAEGPLDRWFCPTTLVDLNLADPAAVQSLVLARTDDESEANRIALAVQGFHQRHQTITADQLDFVLGTHRGDLTRLLGIQPTLRLDRVSDEVLRALVTSALWSIPEAMTKADRLVRERAQGSLGLTRVQEILQITPTHPFLSIWTSRPRTGRVVYRAGDLSWSAVFVDVSTGDQPSWRVIEREGNW